MKPIAAALLAFVPLTAAAQRVTITPQVGSYVGLKRQVSIRYYPDRGVGPDDRLTGGTLRSRILPSVALGLTAAVETNGLGFEGAFMVSQTRLEIARLPDGESRWAAGISLSPMTVATLRVTLARPLGQMGSIMFGAGGAFTTSHEDGFVPNPTIRGLPGASFSTKVRFARARRTQFEIAMVHNFYSVDVVGDGPRRQHDVMLLAGLGFVSSR